MKKMYFMCMVLFISLSTTMWTACSDDDDPQKDPTEEPTQPGDSTTVTTPTHDTTFLVKEFAISDEMTGTKKEFTITRDETSGEVTAISANITQYSTLTIDYSPITREGSEIDIRFYDDNNADQAYIFSLDDQNRISKIEYYYVTNGELDGGPISTYTFTYNENLLTSIDDSEWENNLYKATYSDGNLSSVTVMGEDASCESSNLKNNYSMDLNLLPIGALSEFDNSLIIANILGLIPSTPYLISNISAGGTEMPIEYTETEGAVEAITMEGTLDITLSTEMEVTEIEAAE